MNRIVMSAALIAIGTLGIAGSADAKGCIKGAVLGGAAGSLAGHGKAGAAAGCAIGHHKAGKKDKQSGQEPQGQAQ